MSHPPPITADDEVLVVCFCHNVSRAELLRSIRSGCKSVRELQKATDASTGCGGCEVDLVDLLNAEAAHSSEQ
jgi:NAD(P)H-nitrite reductase large subunit